MTERNYTEENANSDEHRHETPKVMRKTKSSDRLSTPKIDINKKMSMDMGSNLSMKYKQLCFNKFSFPNNTMMNSLKFGEIVMSVDTLLNNDPKPLTIALNSFSNISLISIYSSILSSEELDLINVSQLTEKQQNKLRKTIRKLNEFRKRKKTVGGLSQASIQSKPKTTKASNKNKNVGSDLDKLFSCDSIDNYDIFKATAKNLSMTMNMKFLQLCALRLSRKSWSCLCDSLAVNNTVRILSLNACGVNNVTFECLVPALDKNSNLEILDLSYNYMGDDMAPFIAKIISNQSERRDNIVWLAGLRGEAPKNEDYKTGLQSMILRYNDFGSYI